MPGVISFPLPGVAPGTTVGGQDLSAFIAAMNMRLAMLQEQRQAALAPFQRQQIQLENARIAQVTDTLKQQNDPWNIISNKLTDSLTSPLVNYSMRQFLPTPEQSDADQSRSEMAQYGTELQKMTSKGASADDIGTYLQQIYASNPKMTEATQKFLQKYVDQVATAKGASKLNDLFSTPEGPITLKHPEIPGVPDITQPMTLNPDREARAGRENFTAPRAPVTAAGPSSAGEDVAARVAGTAVRYPTATEGDTSGAPAGTATIVPGQAAQPGSTETVQGRIQRSPTEILQRAMLSYADPQTYGKIPIDPGDLVKFLTTLQASAVGKWVNVKARDGKVYAFNSHTGETKDTGIAGQPEVTEIGLEWAAAQGDPTAQAWLQAKQARALGLKQAEQPGFITAAPGTTVFRRNPDGTLEPTGQGGGQPLINSEYDGYLAQKMRAKGYTSQSQLTSEDLADVNTKYQTALAARNPLAAQMNYAGTPMGGAKATEYFLPDGSHPSGQVPEKVAEDMGAKAFKGKEAEFLQNMPDTLGKLEVLQQAIIEYNRMGGTFSAAGLQAATRSKDPKLASLATQIDSLSTLMASDIRGNMTIRTQKEWMKYLSMLSTGSPGGPIPLINDWFPAQQSSALTMIHEIRREIDARRRRMFGLPEPKQGGTLDDVLGPRKPGL